MDAVTGALREAEAEGLRCQGQPGLHGFETGNILKALNEFLLSIAFMLPGWDSVPTQSGNLPGDFLDRSSVESSPLHSSSGTSVQATTHSTLSSQNSASRSFKAQRSLSYATGILCSNSESLRLRSNDTGTLEEKWDVLKWKTKSCCGIRQNEFSLLTSWGVCFYLGLAVSFLFPL